VSRGPGRALVRVDDLGQDDERDRAAVASLLDAGVAISCGVVPVWLAPATVRFFGEMQERHGPRIEVHQHGCAHLDRRGHGDDAEFGSFRDREEQRAELRHGLETLAGTLGDLVWSAFSPPFGAHDPALLEDLRTCGFRAVSTLRPRCALDGLPDFPTAVDGFAWKPTRERDWPDVVGDWRGLEARPYLGLVLHPRFMAWRTLRDVGGRVADLVAGRRVLTLRELAGELPLGA
jgi:hypothetical protein